MGDWLGFSLTPHISIVDPDNTTENDDETAGEDTASFLQPCTSNHTTTFFSHSLDSMDDSFRPSPSPPQPGLSFVSIFRFWFDFNFLKL